MSLHFDVTGDNSNFLRKLEETKRGVSEAAKFMESQGKKIDSSFNSVSFGDALKKQIHDGAQSVNGLTAQIIKQKAVIKDIEQDVRALGAAYRKAGAGTTKGNALFADYGRAKGALQEEKNALFGLQTEQSQARLSVRKLKDEYSLYHKEGQNVVDSNNNMALSFKKTLAVIGGTAAIKKFVSDVLRVRGEFQQLEVAFKTMLGSEDKATTLMSQLVKTAATTPFDLQSVANGAKQLLAYGISAEAVNGTLVQLGDIAAGLSIPLNDLVWLYGTTMTQGRLFTQDFRQFQSRGIPLADELAKQFGVTKDKVGELVTAGKVGFPEVQKAIVAMTSEGGKFGGLMEAQSKTITGQISNIEDSFSTMYNNIGKQSEGFINDALSGVSYLIENYETIGKTILELAAVYGTYKAVLMSVAAYQSMAVGITYAAEITELSKLIPLKQQSANQDIIAAVNSGKLTQAKAEQVIALRAEVAAKIQSLQATEAQTKVEYASAMASYKVATQRMLLAKQNMAIAQSQMSIAIKSGTVEEIAIAKKNAQTTSLELNNAAVAKNTAHKGVNIAATNSKSASEALNTLETGKNSVAQTVNTASTNILTAAKTKLAAASKALGLSMLANPYVLATAAVVGLGYGIYKLITYHTDAEKAQAKLNDAVKEYEKSSLSEQRELAKLKGELSGLTKGTDEYNTVKDKIVKGFGKYYSGLDTEIEKVGLTETAYNKLTEAINKSFGARQYEKFASEQQEELSNTMAENLGNIQDKLLEELGNETGSKIYAKIRDGVMRGSLSLGKGAFDIQGLDTESQAALDKISGVADNDIYRNKDIELYIRNIILANKATDELDQKAKERFGIDGKPVEPDNKSKVNEEKKAASEWLSSYKKAYEDAEKAYSDFLKSKQVMSDADRDKELKKLKEDRDTAKATYESKGGSTSSDTKQESSADKLREQQEKLNLLTNKQALDQSRSEQDLQNLVAQAKIDSMQDGSTKTIAQMQLNHKKEMQQFEREKEDKLRKAIEDARAIFDAEEDAKKAKNPKHVKGTFDASGIKLSDSDTKLYGEQKDSLDKKQKKEIEDNYKSLRESYQDYTDQRIAIEEKYNNDIAALQESRKKYEKEGSTEKVQQTDRAIAQATKNKGKELMGMDYDKLKESPEYVRAFENLKETSSETLNSLLAQLENAKGAAAQVLSPDQLREYTTTIQEIMDELDSRNPWQALSDKKQELANAEEELAQAQVELENARQQAELVKGGAKIENGVSSSKFNSKTGKIDSTKAYLTEAQALDKVEEKTKNYSTAKDNVTKTNSKVKKSEEEVKAEIDELSKSISDVGAAIGGPAGEIISLIGDIGTFTMTAMSGVQAAADTSATAISTVEKASVILAIISAAFQIAMKIASLFNNDDEYQKEIEKLQGRIEQLQWELDNADAIRLQNNTFQALQKVKEVYAETTEEVLKLHAANGKYLNAFDRMFLRARSSNEILQKSAEKLALAYANIDYTADKALGTEKFSGAKEQLTNIAQQQLLIQEQIRNEDSKKKTDHGKIEDWERQIQELGEQANAIINEIVEGIIGGSAADIAAELGDAFIEAFQSGENAAEAWGDKVDDIVANVLKRMLVSKYLEAPLGEIFDKYKSMWYKDGEFAGIDAIMESMGGFSNDLNAVGSEFQTIWDALPDNIKSMFAPDEKSTSQDSTKGGFESMSQDTGSELNGRFTALQISNEEIKNSMLSMLASMNLISVSTSNNGITLVEIRNIMISSNSHLEDIAKYTKTLLEVGIKLDKIESNTKGLTSR